MAVLFCAVCQSPWRHSFGKSSLCSAGGCQPEGRNFPSPTSGLEFSFYLGSVKQISSAWESSAFGVGLVGREGHSCCYTESWGSRSGLTGAGANCMAQALAELSSVLWGKRMLPISQVSCTAIEKRWRILNWDTPAASEEWNLHRIMPIPKYMLGFCCRTPVPEIKHVWEAEVTWSVLFFNPSWQSAYLQWGR